MGAEGYYNASNDFSISSADLHISPFAPQPHWLEDVVYAEGWRARLARYLLDVPFDNGARKRWRWPHQNGSTSEGQP